MLYKDNHADRIVLTSFPPTGNEPTLVLKKKKKINEGDSVAISLGIWRVNIQSMWNRCDIGVQMLEDSVRSVPCGESDLILTAVTVECPANREGQQSQSTN